MQSNVPEFKHNITQNLPALDSLDLTQSDLFEDYVAAVSAKQKWKER